MISGVEENAVKSEHLYLSLQMNVGKIRVTEDVSLLPNLRPWNSEPRDDFQTFHLSNLDS